jgi:DNA-binding transcriptional LysR family regulator
MVSLGNPAQSPIDIALGKQGKARHVVLTSPTFTANAAVLVGTDLIMSLPSRLLPSRLLASRLLASRLLASRLLGAFLAGDYVSFDLPFSLSEYSYWLMWHRRAANDTALTWLTSLVRAAS